jgi:ribosomal protein S18 acetylase RimI-like enzyme
MARFAVPLTDYDIAAQVAAMVNTFNQWYTVFTPHRILTSPSLYLVELCFNQVVGCAALTKEYPKLSKIQHLCVLPQYRKRGIAKRLVEQAIVRCETEFICMTIREDNLPSLSVAKSAKFRFINKNWFRDHWTHLVARPQDFNRRQYIDNFGH